MTGLPGFGYKAFFKAEKKLLKHFKVINPARLNTAGEDWNTCLRNDIRHIAKYCDGMALLKNWKKSKGAKLEVSLGIQLGMFFICAETLKPLNIKLEQKFKVGKI